MAISLKQIKPKAIVAIGIFILVAIGLLSLILFQVSKKSPAYPKKEAQIKKSTEVIPPKESRPTLSKNIQDIKNKIIATKIGEDNGTLILYKSPSYVVTYVPTPDIFFVNILQKPFDSNKDQAETWFLNFGLRQEDLCNLPVRFLVNFNAPREERLSYNPFPTSCQK